MWELDRLQYKLGDGPCVHAMRDTDVVLADRLRHDQRWPQYVRGAVENGVMSQMTFQLYADEKKLGVLNFYSTHSEDIHPEAEHIAEHFATHAALALGHARKESEMAAGMQSRQIIGVATGLVMSRYHIDRDKAFHFLVRASTTSNLKLRDIAAEVVSAAEDKFEA